MWKEEKRAAELSTLMEENCEPLEKCSLGEEECEGFESLQDSSSEEEPTETRSLEAICGKLNSSKSEFGDKILFLAKELKEEESEQDGLVVDISKRIQSLEDESKLLKSQVAEAKTTFKIFQMNEELLKIAIKDTLSESSQLQESQKQLLQEAEEWKEQVSELNEQKITFEDSKVYAKQVLCDKENQIKSLTEYLLKMRDWTAVLGEDVRDDNLELEMSDSENSTLSGSEPKGDLKKLIHTAKLKAYLKTLEGERNQIYTQLTEVDKTKGELIECIKNLQAEHASLQSENEHLENENQKLQHKLKVMTEMYPENEKILNRKLTVEENYWLEKEEKRSKGDEKITHATEDLETYRKRANDLEELLERTIHSYQGQIISHEKKAHDNWLAAWTAERNLSDLKKENFYLRQKLTETELKFELLEKDLYALDAPNTAFCREHSPYGLSPLGQPSSETRAFLSLPTLLEGSLGLSPLLPGRRRRDLRGPGNPQDHQMTNERGESSSDKLTHPHREPSHTGSLSPPWEQDHRMIIPPSGQPYPAPALPLHRQDRFYANIGRPSGPAGHRRFNMPDGSMSSEMESSGNDSTGHLSNLNMPDAFLPTKSKVTGPGVVPLIRGSLFPMDARGPYMRMRQGPPFPLLPGSMYGASCDYFPPRDFSGPPPPPLAMRNVCSPRSFPHYLLPRAGFYHHILKEETETETSGETSPSSPHSSVPDTPSESQASGFSPVLEQGPDYHCWEILHCSFACQ